MQASRAPAGVLAIALAVAGGAIVGAGQSGQLPLAPLGVRGEALFPYLEGWYRNADGTSTILLGYFNRNQSQTFEIPIGPNNRIEPGGPDQGQPTHFLVKRQYGAFTITVPKDFGTRKLTWTVVANGQTNAVTFWLNPPYFIEPFKNQANGNTPPVIKFGDGPELTGPPRGFAQTLAATVAQPVPLSLWASDKPATTVFDPNPPPPRAAGGTGQGREPPPAITIVWTKYRGPGGVTFADERLPLADGAGSQATTTASFSEPGEYWLRATANDQSGDGGGGDQCCWTTAHVKVNVKESGAGSGR